jgi:hypothetical protein
MQYDSGDMVVIAGPSQSKYGPFAPEGVRGMVDRVDGRGVWVTLLAPWKDVDGNTWWQSDITQLYHPRDVRPYGSSSGRLAALMRVASGGCEDEHSWAWVSPTGDFVEVDHHSKWALINYPDETYAEYERSLRDSPSDRTVSPGLYMALARSAIYDHESFYDRPPQDLLQRGQKYQVSEEVRRRAAAKGMPTLSMGSWPLNKRLTAAEERFLEAEGVYPEVVEVDRDNAWNRKMRKTWEEHRREIYSDTLTSAKKALHKAGWISVANAYSLGGLKEPTAKQWESFFRNVIDCWKAVGIRPPVEREKLDLAVGDRYTEMPYEDAIDRYCPRRLQDELYEYLLEGHPSQTYGDRFEARQEREREEYAERLRQRGVDPFAPIPLKVTPPVRPPNPMRERKLRERYPARRASAERIAARYLAATYRTAAPLDDYHSMPSQSRPSTVGWRLERERKDLERVTSYFKSRKDSWAIIIKPDAVPFDDVQDYVNRTPKLKRSKIIVVDSESLEGDETHPDFAVLHDIIGHSIEFYSGDGGLGDLSGPDARFVHRFLPYQYQIQTSDVDKGPDILAAIFFHVSHKDLIDKAVRGLEDHNMSKEAFESLKSRIERGVEDAALNVARWTAEFRPGVPRMVNLW